ncbi:MAG: thrombospondin type 3 repeat-containing protein [Pseudomonadota bacterium]
MRKTMMIAIFFALAAAACGGGSGSGSGSGAREYKFSASYPDKLSIYASELKAKATLIGPGESVLSAPADGQLSNGTWSFSILPIAAIPDTGATLRIEFRHSAAQDILLAVVSVPLTSEESAVLPDVAATAYDFTSDDDSDGLPNVDELVKGTDPRNSDTDGDGVPDGKDNCPLGANQDQKDANGNGIGDACDPDKANEASLDINPPNPDTDGDGVPDGKDNCPLGANPDQEDADGDGIGDACDPDIDGDGIPNEKDNCPYVSNPDQADRDDDGVGDACDPDIDGDGIPNASDNCPYVANPRQLTADADGDGVPIECDLDDSDPGVGDDVKAVFVDIAHGSDGWRGTRLTPVASIAAAVRIAQARSLPVYVAAGIYDVSNALITTAVRLYGGFANDADAARRFASRDVRSDAPVFKTILTRSDAPTTLALGADGVVIDGFHIENAATSFDAVNPSVAVDVRSGSASIERNTIAGNANSLRGIGIRVASGTAKITRNRVSGGGRDASGSESMGVSIEGGITAVTDNIVIAGSGRFATGLRIENAAPIAVNNTIDARSGNANLGVAEGVELSGASPVLVNNVVFTGDAPDQYALICLGDAPAAGSAIKNNILARFPSESGASIVIDCDGMGYAAGAGSFPMGNAAVSSNAILSGADPSGLVDASYALAGSSGVDQGLNASAQDMGSVFVDFGGAPRPKGGGYDMGAVETR